LFAEDTAKGFAFIELCRKRFDVVLMNPPFGGGASTCTKYFLSNYPYWAKNILCCFIARANELITDGGLYASIFDRTVVVKSSYEGFRKAELIENIELVADTGWDVLDANVETTCYTFSKKNSHSVFIDLREEDSFHKENKLSEHLLSIYKGHLKNKIHLLQNSSFHHLPNAVIGYDIPDFAKSAFIKFRNLKDKRFQSRKGHDYVPIQHFRLFWERDISSDNLNANPFVRVYNGGKYSTLISPLRDVAIHGQEAKLIKYNKSVYIRNPTFHFEKGIAYGKRGEILDAHILPTGFSFTQEGQAITKLKEDDALVLLAYLNSSVGQYILNTYSGQHKTVGYVNLLPLVDINEEIKKDIINNITTGIKIKNKWFSRDETTPQFLLSTINIFFSGQVISISELVNEASNDYEDYKNVLHKNDILFVNVFGFDNLPELGRCVKKRPLDYPWTEDFGSATEKDLSYYIPWAIISILIGEIFGRWSNEDTDVNIDKDSSFFDKIPDFEYLRFSSNRYAKDVNVAIGILGIDKSDKYSIYSMVNKASEKLFGSEDSNVISQLINSLNAENIEQLFNPLIFFEFHLAQYTKSRREAPIYWPIQTSSGSYSVWLYYHRLNKQTLFTCVNDFVEPKLDSINDDLMTLRKKPSRSKDEEKDFGHLSDMKLELEDFRDELLRIAKFWKPNLNDGVQITAAPLWRLFQHKPWQKKLKQTWEKLEAGEYDWAHLAYSIWPMRVLKKCHQDRSLAISHEVEE
jgi:hypothetical protein